MHLRGGEREDKKKKNLRDSTESPQCYRVDCSDTPVDQIDGIWCCEKHKVLLQQELMRGD